MSCETNQPIAGRFPAGLTHLRRRPKTRYGSRTSKVRSRRLESGIYVPVIAGPKGDTGPARPAGAAGPTSMIARPKGDIGPAGAAGPASTIAGRKGDSGPAGPASAIAGPKGDTEPAGPASTTAEPKGDTGPDSTTAGPKGDTGPAGLAGPISAITGPKGDTGPAGPAGPAGPQEPAGTGTCTTWANINRTEWTNQFSWAKVGPFISPPKTTNFDIVTHNSITPVADKVYNIGQRLRRYNIVHSENVMCETVFIDNGSTWFNGSYTQLQDLPTSRLRVVPFRPG
jgi:hypothetical protein